MISFDERTNSRGLRLQQERVFQQKLIESLFSDIQNQRDYNTLVP
jgi:hypothetical protein